MVEKSEANSIVDTEDAGDTVQKPQRNLKAQAQNGDLETKTQNPANELATAGGGWQHQQLLIDRSLRSMTALTSVFAIIMIAICATYFSEFLKRANITTSVGGQRPRVVKNVSKRNLVPMLIKAYVAHLLT